MAKLSDLDVGRLLDSFLKEQNDFFGKRTVGLIGSIFSSLIKALKENKYANKQEIAEIQGTMEQVETTYNALKEKYGEIEKALTAAEIDAMRLALIKDIKQLFVAVGGLYEKIKEVTEKIKKATAAESESESESESKKESQYRNLFIFSSDSSLNRSIDLIKNMMHMLEVCEKTEVPPVSLLRMETLKEEIKKQSKDSFGFFNMCFGPFAVDEPDASNCFVIGCANSSAFIQFDSNEKYIEEHWKELYEEEKQAATSSPKKNFSSFRSVSSYDTEKMHIAVDDRSLEELDRAFKLIFDFLEEYVKKQAKESKKLLRLQFKFIVPDRPEKLQEFYHQQPGKFCTIYTDRLEPDEVVALAQALSVHLTEKCVEPGITALINAYEGGARRDIAIAGASHVTFADARDKEERDGMPKHKKKALKFIREHNEKFDAKKAKAVSDASLFFDAASAASAASAAAASSSATALQDSQEQQQQSDKK